MPSPACPGRDELKLYVVGKLGDDQSERIDGHLLECPDCQAMLETVGGSDDTLLKSLKQPVEKDEYQEEPECEEAMALVQAIGREPSFAGAGPAEDRAAEESDLGQIRDYKLLSKLGEGGMGAVYKALHVHLKKVVALKLLPKEQTEDEQAVARFKREMVAVGALEHPNIVGAHDAGEHEGKHFLVMEYVKGQDLSKLAKTHGTLPIPEACELIRRAAVGLQHAHESGLVHRDIKPSNLMLTESGEVKILDLGLALLQEHQADKARDLTTTGQMMGTLDYMALEQGDDSHEVDIRADIYSLGATLYKLLCGEAPYGGAKYNTPVKKMMALATEFAPPIRERNDQIPEDLAAIVHRMLERDSEARPATPAEVADLLGPFATGSDLATRFETPTVPGPTDDEPRTKSTASHLSSAMQETGRWKPSASAAPTSRPAAKSVSAQSPAVSPSRRWLVLVIGLALGLLATIVLSTVLTFETKDGTVEIVLANGIDAKDVEVAFKQGGQIIEVADAKQGWTVTLDDGDYSVDLRGSTDRFKLDRQQVTISRDKKEVVRITINPESAQAKAPPLAIAPFGVATAKKHQKAWADYLGVPVERELAIGSGEKMTFVLIPPGEFLMGSNDEKRARLLEEAKAGDKHAIARIASEGPQHRVRISQPFYLGKYEATQAQWQAVTGNNPSRSQQNPSCPVEKVSWNDIQPYMMKLNQASKHSGMRFVLPTEAQWEYACRAGTTTFWHSGNTEAELLEHGWFAVNSRNRMHPVGQLRPNAFGLYDMHGNVSEWCSDWHGGYSVSSANDPRGPTRGAGRMVRGGHYGAHHGYSRSAFRYDRHPTNGITGLGLRLALVLSEIDSEPDRKAEPTKPVTPLSPATPTAKAETDIKPEPSRESEAGDGGVARGLVGHWAFDEREGTVAKDSSGNGRHGTLKNMDAAAWVTVESQGLPQLPGNRSALKFDGEDDVVTVPYESALDLDGPFTLAAWVRREAEPPIRKFERIIDHHFVDGYAFVLMNMKNLKGQTAMQIAGGKAIAYNSGGPPVNDGRWHHVAAVCDGNALRIYHDGKPLAKGRIKRSKPTTKAPLAFGNNASSLPGKEGFTGLLDDIRIYNRALSEMEIKSLAAGK